MQLMGRGCSHRVSIASTFCFGTGSAKKQRVQQAAVAEAAQDGAQDTEGVCVCVAAIHLAVKFMGER